MLSNTWLVQVQKLPTITYHSRLLAISFNDCACLYGLSVSAHACWHGEPSTHRTRLFKTNRQDIEWLMRQMLAHRVSIAGQFILWEPPNFLFLFKPSSFLQIPVTSTVTDIPWYSTMHSPPCWSHPAYHARKHQSQDASTNHQSSGVSTNYQSSGVSTNHQYWSAWCFHQPPVLRHFHRSDQVMTKHLIAMFSALVHR